MQKISLLSVLILFWVIPSLAQPVINADKNYTSPQRSKVVNITAEAIRNGKPNVNEINRENYHQAVLVRDESQKKIIHPPVVEITVTAQEPSLTAGSTVNKEAIRITPQNPAATNRATPATIDITVPAVKK
jgi:ABC-type antimicrobial peptide transport system permease subunit